MPGRLHQKVLYKLLKKLEDQGFHTVDMTGCIPDGIAVKDNKIYAIEVLTIGYGDNMHHSVVINKKKRYALRGYDDTIVKITNKKRWHNEYPDENFLSVQEYEQDIERKRQRSLSAKQVVDDFIDNDLEIT